MKVACLIATWRDEGLLRKAAESAAPYVDGVIILDGGYQSIVSKADAWSRDEELTNAYVAGENVYIVQVQGLWPSEEEKRTALLELARATFKVDEYEELWGLVLDADETLYNGEGLRDFIIAAQGGVDDDQAPGLQRIEPDGASYWAPSRLFQITPSTVYADSDTLFSEEYGETPLGHRLFPSSPGDGVHVRHHWDLRSDARLSVRLRHGAWIARRMRREAA